MREIDWLPSALDDLARMWNKSDSAMRQAITVASARAEARLLADPEKEGESRQEDLRVTFHAPLAITFKYDKAQDKVFVGKVWLYRKRR